MTYIVLSFTVPAVMLSHRGRAHSYPEDIALLAQNNLKYSGARNGTSRAHAKIQVVKNTSFVHVCELVPEI